MRELNLSEVMVVSGAKKHATPKEISWGQLIGGAIGAAIGSVTGPVTGVAGLVAGTVYGNEMENAWNGTEKYYNKGENYKEYIDRQLRDGLFHND